MRVLEKQLDTVERRQCEFLCWGEKDKGDKATCPASIQSIQKEMKNNNFLCLHEQNSSQVSEALSMQNHFDYKLILIELNPIKILLLGCLLILNCHLFTLLYSCNCQ